MFERFTDRARKVMMLADGEARRLNHTAIGSEHILLGLVKEGCGISGIALQHHQVGLRDMRSEIEMLIGRGEAQSAIRKLPLTQVALKVIEAAAREADALHHDSVDTEHLLLAILQVSDSVASLVLAKYGVAHEQVRAVLKTIRTGDKSSASMKSPTKGGSS